MKRTATDWATLLESHVGLSPTEERLLAVLLRAMVAEREAWERNEVEGTTGAVATLARATAARRRAEGVDGE
jgi:hypothetical protein